jgi:hypothetical protein
MALGGAMMDIIRFADAKKKVRARSIPKNSSNMRRSIASNAQ